MAISNPDIAAAKDALDRLSADPQARQLAEERELARWNLAYSLQLARQEGQAEGKAEGKAEIVLQQLTLKFGQLPQELQKRVATASSEELARWADRLLLADTLEAVFSGEVQR